MSNIPSDGDKGRKKRSGTSSGGNRSGRRQEGQNSERRRQQQAASNRNSVLIIILSIVVIIAIVAGVVVNLGKDTTNTAPITNTGDSNVNVDVNNNNLELNKYPAVNELIANYRTAFKNADADLMKKVYNSDEEINVDTLKATTQIITDYTNTQCYTKLGLNSGEYVVYVYDDLVLADIKTTAPNLSIFYVKPAEDGSLYIYRGTLNSATGRYAYDEATQNYINSLYQDEDVSELISTVNTRMDSACANDADLMAFMEKVRKKTDVTPATSETESDSESGSESGESESQTESASDSETADGGDN